MYLPLHLARYIGHEVLLSQCLWCEFLRLHLVAMIRSGHWDWGINSTERYQSRLVPLWLRCSPRLLWNPASFKAVLMCVLLLIKILEMLNSVVNYVITLLPQIYTCLLSCCRISALLIHLHHCFIIKTKASYAQSNHRQWKLWLYAIIIRSWYCCCNVLFSSILTFIRFHHSYFVR